MNRQREQTASRRPLVVALSAILAVTGIASTLWFVPLFPHDDKLDSHLASQVDLIGRTHDVFDNGLSPSPSHSPYGPIQSFEPRKRERRNLAEVLRGYTSAIAVLRTERGLVVERVSTSELQLGRFTSLTHTELRPDEVPQGVLTAAEASQHHTDFDARGALGRPYTTGGYDG